MKRLAFILTGVVLLGACGSGELVVQAQLEGETAGAGAAEPIALRDLTIRVFPFDRDALFDSLEAAYPEPEPEIPASLLSLQDSVVQFQEESQAAESQWLAIRDSLQTLSRTLEGMHRGQAQYRLLYRDFQDLAPQEQTAERRSEQAFARFTEAQQRLIAQSQEIAMQRQLWEDEAFAPVDGIIAERLKAMKREIQIDTTRAGGIARFRIPPGRWWVTARYPLVYQELYWNVPVEVQRGEPVEIRLTRENAQVRPKL